MVRLLAGEDGGGDAEKCMGGKRYHFFDHIKTVVQNWVLGIIYIYIFNITV